MPLKWENKTYKRRRNSIKPKIKKLAEMRGIEIALFIKQPNDFYSLISKDVPWLDKVLTMVFNLKHIVLSLTN